MTPLMSSPFTVWAVSWKRILAAFFGTEALGAQGLNADSTIAQLVIQLKALRITNIACNTCSLIGLRGGEKSKHGETAYSLDS